MSEQEGTRFQVRRGDHPAEGWFVVDTQTGETVAQYTRRTNWLDEDREKPYGPEAAAHEMTRRLNEGEARAR